ncbi:glycoside hydrolase 5 family protein [Micromonospora sp. AKA38]|uniref:hypothetical protein n=1 Tax=Micromonospora sp. AKA38 TaxID=2733861 RepID=UPI0022C8C5D8|nr:hypothetical protein [Micromonospora sp. AKA38]GHJ15482.1 hypothetical protein TPA0908_34770 [Micromonospora sp. AKA38]
MDEDENNRPGRGLSRRSLIRLTGGAAAAVGVGAYLGAGQPASAAPFYRAHGPVLTDGYQTWLTAISNQSANLAKVVTGWGLAGGWAANPDHVWTACGATDHLIVRTVTGDTNTMIDANNAVNEIRNSRFFEYKRIRSGAGKCIIELGNEPNIGVSDIWGYGWCLSATIDRIRAEFPGALICGTALSPNKGVRPDDWYGNQNYRDAIAKCDFVGVHFYSNPSNGSFIEQGNVNELTYAETLQRAASIWPGKRVIGTEYSIRTTAISQYDKGYKYANLIHFDNSVAGNLWGATYYHVQTNPGGVDVNENVGSEGARGYRRRLSEGGL